MAGPSERARPLARRRRQVTVSRISIYWTLPALIFLLVFLVLPLIANVIRSMTVGEAATEGSFFFYIKLLTDPYYADVVYQTLKVAMITTIACLIVGYPVAYFMVRYAGKWNGIIIFCLIAPLLTSIIMRTFGWTVLFARRGLVNNWLVETGIIDRPLTILNQELIVYVGLVHVLAPFMVLSISSVLQTIDQRLEESAQILGASRLTTFFRITVPLSLDGIATGCILVFVLTNGSFLTMLLLGGGSVTTLSLLIYQQFSLTQDIGFAAAMGNLLLLFALIALTIQIKYIRRKGTFA